MEVGRRRRGGTGEKRGKRGDVWSRPRLQLHFVLDLTLNQRAVFHSEN
jgi:hypothetical protein